MRYRRIEPEEATPFERATLEEFNQRLEALCCELGVELQHQDSQGAAFLVLRGTCSASAFPSYMVTEETDLPRPPAAPISESAKAALTFFAAGGPPRKKNMDPRVRAEECCGKGAFASYVPNYQGTPVPYRWTCQGCGKVHA